MSEPSKDAWELTNAVVGGGLDRIYAPERVALALQKLMDEKKALEAELGVYRGLADHTLEAVAQTDRAEAAEAKLAEARATIARLNRRCQAAEAVADQNLDAVQRAGVSIGRSLANYGYSRLMHELRELAAARPDDVGLRELIATWSSP
jgi:hypothetical protein